MRIEITLQLCLTCLFAIVMYFLLRLNYFIYLFDVVTFVDEVRITLYFGLFQLRMEITLQLRFVSSRFVTYFYYVTITLLFVCSSYVF